MTVVAPSTRVSLDDLFASETPACTLRNAHCSVLVTAAGTGFVEWDGVALNRWRGDTVEDSDGVHLYIRDLDRGVVWSAGYQPTRVHPDGYVAELGEHAACIERQDYGIRARMEIAPAPGGPAELRRLTLTNESAVTRRLDVTSYAEVVLVPRPADLAHPAFTRLFVETERAEGTPVLLARRRRRGSDETPRWLFHAVVGAAGEIQHETDRARFIGRGRTLANPAALSDDLSGTVGCVLDPIVSLRAPVTLEAGRSASLLFLLGGADSRDSAIRLAAELESAYDSEDVALVGDIPASPTPERPSYVPLPLSADGAAVSEDHDLLLANGTGGFTPDAAEYVIHLRPDAGGRVRLPPAPWVNVVANPSIGFVATERGSWHTWVGNSREFRLSPWSNDPVCDPSGEALYVRDDAEGTFWSPLPALDMSPAHFEVRHGFGYTRYRTRVSGLDHETLVFVPVTEPVKVALLRITNRSDQTRRLTVFSYTRLVLGGLAENTAGAISTDVADGAVFAQNPDHGTFGESVVLAAMAAPGRVYASTDRAAFVGRHGSIEAPRAVTGASADQLGGGGDPCAVLETEVVLAPGDSARLVVLLGMGSNRSEAEDIQVRYSAPGFAEQAFDEAAGGWRDLLSAVQIRTPEPALDVLANGWLLYQTLSCRMWGRTAFYQSGGAFGYRDQLQDAMALLMTRPDLAREQILLHAGRQFVEGDVLHWWHPPDARGLRTRFSDDLLWLPYAVGTYLDATGEAALLDEEAPFLTARPLEEGEDEAFLSPSIAAESDTIFEHACRAIDRSLTAGAHGLPLMGSGDWNDGMNRVGREGRGESVWLGFFLFAVLNSFIPICEARDEARAARYSAYRARLHTALNDAGWDGGWYRRAFYDDGSVLGSARNEECRIDAIAQAWAVLSGAAPAERAATALDALEAHLIDEEARIIRLLTPAFDKTAHDPGYIKGYVPGVRENGGQYTHGALWAVRAMAEAGRRERAAPLLRMLAPVWHTQDPEGVARYMAEPYVVAADVYSVAPHVGRGGWTWYTGSAGWMYRVMLESILGVTVEGGCTLVIRPCIPESWPGFTMRYRTPAGGVYEVDVSNGGEGRVLSATLDGASAEVSGGAARIRLEPGQHHVEVSLG